MNKLSMSEDFLSFYDVVISVHSVNLASSQIHPGLHSYMKFLYVTYKEPKVTNQKTSTSDYTI